LDLCVAIIILEDHCIAPSKPGGLLEEVVDVVVLVIFGTVSRDGEGLNILISTVLCMR
jgi:hypothetical protein